MATYPTPTLQTLTVNGATSLQNAVSATQPITMGQLASTATGSGSDLVSFPDGIAPTYLKTVSDIVNGERISVFRNIPKANWANVRAGTDTTDYTSQISALLSAMATANFGDLYFPYGTLTASALSVASNITLSGIGTLKKLGGVDAILLTLTGSNNSVLGLTFNGSAAQPTLGSVNDIIRLQGGSFNTIRGVTINNSNGGGIAGYNTAKNVLAFNRIFSVHDNGILLANLGSDDNLVQGNYIDTTTTQDGIFLTASAGSTATTNYIYRNKVLGNTVKNCADSGIELGIHSSHSEASNNHIENCLNPELLIRDAIMITAIGNSIVCGAAGGATHDGIAVSQQTEVNWDYQTVLQGNNVTGEITRSGIWLQGANGVTIVGGKIQETFATVNATTGAGLVARGIAAGSGLSNISIKDVDVTRVSRGIDLNYSGSALSHVAIDVQGNRITQVDYGIGTYNCTFTQSRIGNNTISSPTTYAIDNRGTGLNATNDGNHIDLTGYSSAAPVAYSASDIVAPTLTNLWVNGAAGNDPAGYYKDSCGVVHLVGLIKSGTMTAAAFTLPVGFRPSGQEVFSVSSNDAFGDVYVTAAGAVIPTTGSNLFISLSGITFKAA